MRRELGGGAVDDARAEAPFVAQQLAGRRLQTPDQAGPRQGAQDVERGVDLPPAETLAHAALTGVMVVVPALAHGEYGQQPVVARVVAGDIALAAAHMRERVDAERGVIDQA